MRWRIILARANCTPSVQKQEKKVANEHYRWTVVRKMQVERYSFDENRLLLLHFAHSVGCLLAPVHLLDRTLAQIFLPNIRCPVICVLFFVREQKDRMLSILSIQKIISIHGQKDPLP